MRTAILYKCEVCRRVPRPKVPIPSQLPSVDEFNVLLALYCFEGRDTDGNNLEFLGIICCRTMFHAVCSLEVTHTHTNRARRFFAEFADYLEEEPRECSTGMRLAHW